MKRGPVVWITGLPSSGKSTLARLTAERLRSQGRACVVLDGDEVRAAIVPPHGYEPDGRRDFYETLARLAALAAAQGLIVLVPATANRRRFRERARGLAERFVEVHVDTPPDEVRRRDSKGLYEASEAGDVGALPGAGAPYEPPEHADVVAAGGRDERALDAIAAIVADAQSA